MLYPENCLQKLGFTEIISSLNSLCITEGGKQLSTEIHFSTDYELIRSSLTQVNEYLQIITNGEPFRWHEFPDLSHRIASIHIEGTYLSSHEFHHLRNILDSFRSFVNFFNTKDQSEFPELTKIIKATPYSPLLTDIISQAIDSQGNVKSTASKELQSIRNQISSIQIEIGKKAQSMLRLALQSGWVDSGQELAIRNNRLVIPINANYKRMIKGIIHDESATGKTFFIEPEETVLLNNDLLELEMNEKREIIKVLSTLTTAIRPYLPEIKILLITIANLDLIRAKALLAMQWQAVMPILSNKPIIHLRNARHPLLEIHLKMENKNIVPLSLEIDEQNRIIVISGPNAGGKSISLQTTGLLQLLLQCGMLIPVGENSEIGIFNDIFLNMGDEQSFMNDLSTYSSHLKHLKQILKNADAHSLVLIDEFGAGTEPIIGGAIAEAIMEELVNAHCKGIITTHYSNLKQLAMQTEGLLNSCMLIDGHTMQPLYILSMGTPGSSYAIEVARMMGIPDKILDKAQNIAGIEHIHFDRNLRQIARDKRYWETKRQKIQIESKKLENTLLIYQHELEKLSETQKKLVKETKESAKLLLSEVNKKVENAIREIRESQAEKNRVKEIREELFNLKSDVENYDASNNPEILEKIGRIKNLEKALNPEAEKSRKSEKPEEESDTFTIGDKVTIKGQFTAGVIKEIHEKHIMVEIGHMLTKTTHEKIEKITSKEYRNRTDDKRSRVVIDEDIKESKLTFRTELDVRGMRAEEALNAVRQFIDKAIMVNTIHLKILHGKGDGILRELIRKYLKTEPVIKSFRDENTELGGAGKTVLELY